MPESKEDRPKDYSWIRARRPVGGLEKFLTSFRERAERILEESDEAQLRPGYHLPPELPDSDEDIIIMPVVLPPRIHIYSANDVELRLLDLRPTRALRPYKFKLKEPEKNGVKVRQAQVEIEFRQAYEIRAENDLPAEFSGVKDLEDEDSPFAGRELALTLRLGHHATRFFRDEAIYAGRHILSSERHMYTPSALVSSVAAPFARFDPSVSAQDMEAVMEATLDLLPVKATIGELSISQLTV